MRTAQEIIALAEAHDAAVKSADANGQPRPLAPRWSPTELAVLLAAAR